MGFFADLSGALKPSAIASAFSRGAPAMPSRLGQDGPPIGGSGLLPPTDTRYQLVQRLAIDADVKKTVAIFDRADSGRTWDLFDLYDDGLTRDSRLRSVASKRVHGVTSRPWVCEPPDELKTDREAQQIASNCKIILREIPLLQRRLAHLATGTLVPFAVSPLDWRVDFRGWYTPVLEWAHGNQFGFDNNARIGFRVGRGSYDVMPLEAYPDCFVVHAPMGGWSTYPWRMGALRTRILPSLVKRNGMRWWAILLERWGQPQVYATQSDGDTNGTAILDALKRLSEYWQAVFPKGVEPKPIEMSGQVSSEAHARFIEMANTDDAIAILGQNLSTEVQGGSYAATEAHTEVADDLLRGDLVELSETVTQQIVARIVAYNWPGAPVPTFRFVAERAAKIEIAAVQAGLYTDDEFRASEGYGAMPNGTGSKFRQPQSPTPSVAITTGGAEAAAATVQDTALNGAQVSSLQGIVLATIQEGLPISAAKVMIRKAFPTIDLTEVDQMFADVRPAPPSAPMPPASGGEPSAPPFGQTASSETVKTSTAPSPTSAPSSHPLARALLDQ